MKKNEEDSMYDQIRSRALTVGNLETILAYASVSSFLGNNTRRAWLSCLQEATNLPKRPAEEILDSLGVDAKSWANKEYAEISGFIQRRNAAEDAKRRKDAGDRTLP